jgi:hypothetical protein
MRWKSQRLTAVTIEPNFLPAGLFRALARMADWLWQCLLLPAFSALPPS